MGKVLTGAEILALDDLPRERLEVPEWGDAIIFIRTMTGLERDAWEESIIKMTPRRVNGKNIQEPEIIMKNARAKLVAKVAVNEAGEQMWKPEEVTALGGKNCGALDRCFSAAQRLNHLSNEDVEELTKNSEGGTSDDSGSA